MLADNFQRQGGVMMSKRLILLLAVFAAFLVVVNSVYAYPNPYTVRMDAMMWANDLSPSLDLQSNLIATGCLAGNPGSIMSADNTAVCGRLSDIGDPKIEKVGLLSQSGTIVNQKTENTAQANKTNAIMAVVNENNSTNTEKMWTSFSESAGKSEVAILRTQVNAKIPNLLDDENISVTKTAKKIVSGASGQVELSISGHPPSVTTMNYPNPFIANQMIETMTAA